MTKFDDCKPRVGQMTEAMHVYNAFSPPRCEVPIIPQTHGEKWLAACLKRLEGYCKARSLTAAGYRDLGDTYAVAAIRDRTGHRVELFFYADSDPTFDAPSSFYEDFTAANFDILTAGLVRPTPVSKRQGVLPYLGVPAP